MVTREGYLLGYEVFEGNRNDTATVQEIVRAMEQRYSKGQQKSDLKLRLVWHQRGDRVEAHILVCFLAYVLRKTLEGWSERAGLGHSPGELLEEFARIQSTDVVFPTSDGRVVRLRCVVQPDRAQRILLDHLGLTLLQRLRVPKGVPLM